VFTHTRTPTETNFLPLLDSWKDQPLETSLTRLKQHSQKLLRVSREDAPDHQTELRTHIAPLLDIVRGTLVDASNPADPTLLRDVSRIVLKYLGCLTDRHGGNVAHAMECGALGVYRDVLVACRNTNDLDLIMVTLGACITLANQSVEIQRACTAQVRTPSILCDSRGWC
jgi:hypothetical protein